MDNTCLILIKCPREIRLRYRVFLNTRAFDFVFEIVALPQRYFYVVRGTPSESRDRAITTRGKCKINSSKLRQIFPAVTSRLIYVEACAPKDRYACLISRARSSWAIRQSIGQSLFPLVRWSSQLVTVFQFVAVAPLLLKVLVHMILYLLSYYIILNIYSYSKFYIDCLT